MKKSILKPVLIILILLLGVAVGILICQNEAVRNAVIEPFTESFTPYDDTRQTTWDTDFRLIDIKSTLDNSLQKAYFYKSKSDEPKALIVSLHSWSGYYDQKDGLAGLSKENDLNYIHPDFRGANWTKDACCSELALNDIDDAITFAIQTSNVDTSKIYVIGSSGGGYATLSTFMKSKHNIKKFSAWVPISDLVAWYSESKIIGNKYAQNILDCTESKNGLDIEKSKSRSPIYWNTPAEKLINSKLTIYTGIYDGIQGSVPITHAINFYNKILDEQTIPDLVNKVSDSEKLNLLEFRKPLGEFGNIGDRRVFLKKKSGNVSLTIFEGKHEMLTEFAFNQLIED